MAATQGSAALAGDSKHAGEVLVTSVESPLSPLSPMSPLSPTLPEFKASYVTDADRVRATELMTEQRLKDGKEKKTKKAEPFTYKEANPVLDSIVANSESPPSPGLVQALLDQGGNVSIARPKTKNLFKLVIRKDRKERRSDLLAQATKNCGVEVVWILTQSADEIAKNEALPFAMTQNEPKKALILVQAGADSEPLCTEFLMAVDNDWDEMVAVVLPATKGPCQPCRNQGLVKAANRGSGRNLQLLLDKGADADFESGAALQKAIADGREDLTTAIAACGKPPSSDSLDLAVDVAYSKLASDPEKRHRIIKTCLETGAKGSKTNQALVDACKNGEGDLVDILLVHGASVDYDSGAAMKFSVTSRQPDLLTTLLRGKPSNETMAIVVPHTMDLDDIALAHQLVDILLSANLRGDSIAKSLITAIQPGIAGGDDAAHLELIRLIVEKGDADVNFDGGKSVVLAAEQGRANVLAILLQRGPSVESLNVAFPCAVALVDADLRLEIATMILEAGAKGKVVDDALVASAATGKAGASLTSAILKQSSIDYDGGSPLVTAVKSRCLEQISCLLAGSPAPSSTTMSAAWTEADAIGDDDDFQLKALEALLAKPVDVTLQDNSLVAAATRGNRGIPICALLLQHQASPEHLDGAAMVAAAKGLHLDTLACLAGSATSEIAFVTAFDAFTDGEQWLQPRGLEVVHFLLDHGATGREVDAAFCQAARMYEPDAVDLLATAINPEVVSVALVLAMSASEDWLALNNQSLELLHSLLKLGADKDSVNAMFLKAVDAYARGLAPEILIDTFLTIGAKADVNYDNGEALHIAIQNGNAQLLAKLISHGATNETMALAFAETVIAVIEDENVVLSLLDVLFKDKKLKPDVNAPPEGYQPPLFACLATHPQSAKLVKRLLKLGCNTEAEVEHFLYDDEDLAAEPVTVVCWALSQPEKRVTSAAIEALIEGKAKVNFTAKSSKATPLILAAKHLRGDIVGSLIKAKATIVARDRFDRSALFYASRGGDLEAVNELLKAKPPTNDGSLQEAAKNLHSDVVAALIKAKHSPDFPSSKEQHQGRTAMQEMAFMCDASNDAVEMEATLRALLKGKPNLLEKSRGKNALFLALDNAHPVPIVKALLDCVMWEYINKPENVYIEVDPETGTKYYLSPTVYVEKGFSQGPESDNDALINILRDKRCEDRFYAEEGAEQPDGAVGMPQDIIDAERKRKDHEEKLRKKEIDHQLKLLHAKQEAELKEEIERQKHEEKMFREDELSQQKMEQKEMLHQQQLAQAAQKAAQKEDIAASAGALKISLQQQADASKMRAAQARAEFEEKQKLRMAQLKAASLQQEQELKLSFQSKANEQKLVLQERQNKLVAAASERKLLTARKLAETHAKEARNKVAVKEKQNELAVKLMRGTASHKKELHAMKTKEMKLQGENMKVKMLDKYFSGQPKNLKRITAG